MSGEIKKIIKYGSCVPVAVTKNFNRRLFFDLQIQAARNNNSQTF
jgi:hypothetical protein